MDVARTGVIERRRRRRWAVGAAGLVVVTALSVGLARMKPAAPGVERSAVWTGKAERGPMLREVRGSGTLVPEEIRWIPAATSGRVDRRILEPGANVTPVSVILVLTNPQVEQEAVEAESRLRIAEADLANLRVRLDSELMTLRSDLARIEFELTEARLRAEANEELAASGLVSAIERKSSRALADSLATRLAIEKDRVQAFARAVEAQTAAQQAVVADRRGMRALRRRLLDSLTVRAALQGVLQEVTVEVGQQVTPGMNLARVAEPDRLIARLRIPANQARDLAPGLPAVVNTRAGLVAGRLSRIDPAVREGTVTVDVRLTGDLPRGTRPDQPVDGTIEIERLDDVVFVGRPALARENSTTGLFRIEDDGRHASRVQVKLGRSSVTTMEVVEGLRPGDEVILSDTSRWDDYDRIRLD